jgi:hypothetical protein
MKLKKWLDFCHNSLVACMLSAFMWFQIPMFNHSLVEVTKTEWVMFYIWNQKDWVTKITHLKDTNCAHVLVGLY